MTGAARWILALALIASVSGRAADTSEYEVKAAFLYNFAKYVEFPPSRFASANTPIQLCVLGEDPFQGQLARSVAGKRVNGRGVAVVSVESVAEATSCHIVFIARSERSRLDGALASLSKQPVLTVSDIDDFAERGGAIGLTVKNQKVRFEVNVNAARQSGLKLSSQLLKVAVHIFGQAEDLP